MAYYRIYKLDPKGRIRSFDELEAVDDAAVIDVATRMDHSTGIAVWQQARYVGNIDAGSQRFIEARPASSQP